jgi:hypothetical protein
MIDSLRGKLLPDEEIDRDITCRMIAAIFLSLLQSELYSPLVSSIGK